MVKFVVSLLFLIIIEIVSRKNTNFTTQSIYEKRVITAYGSKDYFKCNNQK